MTQLRALGLVVATFLPVMVGCGDDERPSDARPGDVGANRGSPAGGSPGVGMVDRDSDVGIRDFKYVPDHVAIPAGASVEWTNSGDVAHTVTWNSGPGRHFDSGPIEPGKSYRRGFPASGLIEYRCAIHPGMAGSVRVYR